MNILIIDEEVKYLENYEGTLTLTKKNCFLHIKGVNKITKLTLDDQAFLQIDLQDDAKLHLKDNWTTENSQIKLTINSQNNTELTINLFLEAKKDYDLLIQNNLLGDNNKTNVKINAVTDQDGKVKIKSIGSISKNTKDNEFLEELKGLTLDSQPITFFPDLIVDSDSVIANHNATIKCLEEEELFYLQSKGIAPNIAKQLIKDGFLNKLIN